MATGGGVFWGGLPWGSVYGKGFVPHAVPAAAAPRSRRRRRAAPVGRDAGRPLCSAARARRRGQSAGGVLAAPANGGAPQCRAPLLRAAAGGGP